MTETYLPMFMYLFDVIITVSTDKECMVVIIDYNLKKMCWKPLRTIYKNVLP